MFKETTNLDDVVSFFGRVRYLPENNRTYFNWSGSGFRFNFVGTTAKAYFHTTVHSDEAIRNNSDLAYLGVFLDDFPLQIARFPLDKTEGWYTLVDNLPYGEHKITVVKQTEVGYGRAAVACLSTDGKFLTPIIDAANGIEFIGDSITCGYGNISSNKNPEFETCEENFSLTFAEITAKLLGMKLYCVAASGNGIFHDYGCNTHNLLPDLYLYTDKMLCEHIGVTAQEWDFSRDNVKIVVIKAGQNDAQYCMGADLPEEMRVEDVLAQRRLDFEKKATDFIKCVRNKRPSAAIIYIYEKEMYLKNEIISAIEQSNANIIPFEIEGKKSFEGVGANGHWSACTHSRVAYELVRKIKEL